MRNLPVVVALSGLTLVSSGCAGKPLVSTAPVQFAPSSGPRDLKPTTAEQVLVYEANGSLPGGIYFDGESFQVERDYPTHEAPHESLGAVSLRSDRTEEFDREMMIRRLVEEAAKHGANTLVVTRCGPAESCTGTALRLSSAAPRPVDYPAAAELLRGPPENVPGGAELVGALRPGNLADFAVITLEVSRGHCYGLGLALDKGASLNERALGELKIEGFRSDKLSLEKTLGVRIPKSKRVFSAGLGCPQESGSMKIEITAYQEAPNDLPFKLGEGTAAVAIYSWGIDETRLQERQQQSDQARQESKERNARVREVCELCRRVKEECMSKGQSTYCLTKRDECIRVHGLQEHQCL